MQKIQKKKTKQTPNPKEPHHREKDQSTNEGVAGVGRMKKKGNIVFNTNTACPTFRIYCLATLSTWYQTMAPL